MKLVYRLLNELFINLFVEQNALFCTFVLFNPPSGNVLFIFVINAQKIISFDMKNLQSIG